MPGNKAGGKKAALTNKARYGSDFYRQIGQIGGKVGRTGGFYVNHELAREAGRKGGQISRRGRKLKPEHVEFQQGFNRPSLKDRILARLK